MIDRLLVRGSAAVARRLLLGVGLAVSLAIGPSLAAQEQRTGSLVPRGGGSSMVQEWGSLRPSDRAPIGNAAAARRAADAGHEALRRFAGCLVSGADATRDRRDLTAFLATSPEDEAVNARAVRIAKPNCVYGSGADSTLLRFQPGLLRGAIFRELYLELDGKSPAPVTREDIASAWSSASGSFAANQRFGGCIVEADQHAADSFVRARVSSVEQQASLRDVMARMSGCLTQGLTLQMSRVVLDGVLAEALYRKVSAPHTGGGADGNRISRDQ